VFEKTSNDGCSCTCGFGKPYALFRHEVVTTEQVRRNSRKLTEYDHRSSFEKSKPGPEKTEGASILNGFKLYWVVVLRLDLHTRSTRDL
jgi:hypothetical protein